MCVKLNTKVIHFRLIYSHLVFVLPSVQWGPEWNPKHLRLSHQEPPLSPSAGKWTPQETCCSSSTAPLYVFLRMVNQKNHQLLLKLDNFSLCCCLLPSCLYFYSTTFQEETGLNFIKFIKMLVALSITQVNKLATSSYKNCISNNSHSKTHKNLWHT